MKIDLNEWNYLVAEFYRGCWFEKENAVEKSRYCDICRSGWEDSTFNMLAIAEGRE